jgi:4-amino-4-deoxy-L-arabinose transferase-like glycosyltransferase
VRRIGRYILNGLAVLSLLLCVATVGLWVRSYDQAERIGWASAGNGPGGYNEHYFGVIATDGDLRICFTHNLDEAPSPLPPVPFGSTPAPVGLLHDRLPNSQVRNDKAIRLLGFSAYFSRDSNTPSFTLTDRWIQMPGWLLAVLLALPVGIHLTKRRRHRSTNGFCQRCGYDLRATPDRCPECGTVPNTSG